MVAKLFNLRPESFDIRSAWCLILAVNVEKVAVCADERAKHSLLLVEHYGLDGEKPDHLNARVGIVQVAPDVTSEVKSFHGSEDRRVERILLASSDLSSEQLNGKAGFLRKPKHLPLLFVTIGHSSRVLCVDIVVKPLE
jgi:hypothetical protein